MSDVPDAGGASWPRQQPDQGAPGPFGPPRGPAGPYGADAPPPGAPTPPTPFGAPPGAPPGWAPGAPQGGAGAPGAPGTPGAPIGPYGDPAAYTGPGAYPGYGYGYGYGGYGGPPATDKGARNSLIIAIVGFFVCGVLLGPAAVIEGIKARKRIELSNGRLVGDGLAIGGIILGIAVTALSVLGVIFLVIASSKTPTSRLR